MDVALARTYTAPTTSSHSRLHMSTSSSGTQHPHSQYSTFSHPSRSSSSTQHTSASTHFQSPAYSSTATLVNGGPVSATNNVINRIADKDASLFQTCLALRIRLRGVPRFEEIYQEEEAEMGEDAEPVSLLWRVFTKGFPLVELYNLLDPDNPIVLAPEPANMTQQQENKRSKAAAMQFISACVNRLKFPTNECFILQDLFSNDTSGFVKVIRVVGRVVDILLSQGLLEDIDNEDSADAIGNIKRTQRQHIVAELVNTERTYVQHLELLQAFKKLVEQKGVVSGDVIHNIFLNLNALIDFQHRFLIRVEQTNALPEDEQNWGHLFQLYHQAFRVYEPYIANQRRCEITVMKEFENLKRAGGPLELQQMVESPPILTSFLLKPFQRLSKYPLLLRELRDKGDMDDDRRQDISAAIDIVSAVLEQTNQLIDEDDRLAAVEELKDQVEDWKGHDVKKFGKLLLHGNFTVLKGESGKDSEREYRMYLFEKILLCCKEAKTDKQKSKLMGKPTPPPLRNGKPRLHLKGRIFMQNVTETVFLSKPGNYTCQIFWRGDEAIEFFIIRFQTEEVMKKWRNQVEKQRREFEELARRNHASEDEFEHIRQSGSLPNPYQDDEAYDDDQYEPSDFPESRNGSSTSLRSRSNTGESGPPMPRAPLGKQSNAFNGQPLTLRTQHLPPANGVSPADKQGNSYFSPSQESPISSRTSSSSGMMPFPRQHTPHVEDHNRFTAPAMGRPPNASNGYYPVDPRSGRAPHPQHQASLAQNRMRSASSPDIHQNQVAGRRAPANAPPVPSVPSHLAQNPASINRSQNNSPSNANGPQSRTSAQSPNSKRATEQGYPLSRTVSPSASHHSQQMMAPSAMAAGEPTTPSQLKVKVKIPSKGMNMTLVVGMNISYQSLKDRIDAKLSRATDLSLSNGNAKLKYVYDDEFVSIQDDEDVQTAFEMWKDPVGASAMGEIELYCITPS